MNKIKIISAVLLLVGVLVLGVAIGRIKTVNEAINTSQLALGAVGNMLIEDYMPYVMYNGGINTAKDLTVSGATTLSGTNTISGATTISGAATFTSSAKIGSSGTAFTYLKSFTCTLAPGANVTIGSFETRSIMCGSGNSGETAISGLGTSYGDRVFGAMPTTTTVAQNSIVLTSIGTASTTGFIDVKLTNSSSTPITLTSNATTSFQVMVAR